MKKFLLAIFVFFLFLIITPQANADCGTLTPGTLRETQQAEKVPFHLASNLLTKNKAYVIKFVGGSGDNEKHFYTDESDVNGSLDWNKLATERYATDNTNARFEVYNIEDAAKAVSGGATPFCTEYVTIGSFQCTVNIKPSSPKNGEPVWINVDGIYNRGAEWSYQLSLFRGDEMGNETRLWPRRVADADIVNKDFFIGNLGGGHYLVKLYARAAYFGDEPHPDELGKPICSRGFWVTSEGGSVDPVNPTTNPGANLSAPGNSYNVDPPPLPCAASEVDAKGNCKKVATGLGFSINTDVGGFITSLLGLILSLSGGIAVLLIIISGYRLMISQGNPEKIQPAREQLTAAIVGLLFIIFSLVIIQVIGYDILHIPGFGQ